MSHGPALFTVCDRYTARQLTREAALAQGEALAELGRMTDMPFSPEGIAADVGPISGVPHHGKFQHSLYLTGPDDRPVALIGAHEQSDDMLGDGPFLRVMVLAVDPSLQRMGIATSFAEQAMVRSMALGFTELPGAEQAPLVLSCDVMDVPARRWLADLYRDRFGFTDAGRITDEDGVPFVVLRRAQ